MRQNRSVTLRRGRFSHLCFNTAKTGEAPQLSGNERFLLSVTETAIGEKNAGLYFSERKRMSANAGKRSQGKGKGKDKYKEKSITLSDESVPHARVQRFKNSFFISRPLKKF